MELISIIIPVYNLEKYITKTIKSVISQTYKNIEIIVVDDGSNDKSYEMILQEAEKDNRIIPVHQSNAGVTSARLTGLSKANGEWIGFVDGDDMIETDMYELLLNNAKKYQADISHCGYQMIFYDGRVNYFYDTKKLMIQDNIQGIKDLLSGEIIEPGLWNKLYRKDLFHDIINENVLPLEIKINEDLLMNYFLFSKANQSVFMDICKYHYLVRNSSASRQKLNNNKIYDPIKVKEKILKSIPNSLKKEAIIAYLKTCIYTYTQLLDNNFCNDRKKVQRLISNKRQYLNLLPIKTRLLGVLIIVAPCLFKVLYSLYEKVFQIKKYE